MRRILLSFLALFMLLPIAAGGLAMRASKAAWTPPTTDLPALEVDVDALAKQLSTYIRIDTQQPPGPDSWQNEWVEGEPPETPTLDWVAFLRDILVDGGMDYPWEIMEDAMVIRVPSPNDARPVVWLSHVDVVAVENAEPWTHPPFEGVIRDGFVWGRGAADNKASTLTQLEALRLLKAAGKEPSRPIVLVITPNEEVGGASAAALAKRLPDLGDPEALLDEGSFILPDFLKGDLLGAIAVAEKTFVSYELTTRGEGGHSSMPTGDSAPDRLTRALERIRTWETEAAVPEPLKEAFQRASSHRAFPESVALANADLLAPVLLPIVQKSAGGNAVTRDTVAITIVRTGNKDNVVPPIATATVNARLLPATDAEEFQARLATRIDDPTVEIKAVGWSARATIASSDTPIFKAIETAMVYVEPTVLPVPSQTPGTMDARFFSEAGLPSYRFHPFIMPPDERRRLHAVDERLSLENLERGVRFYWALAQLQ